VMAPADYPGVAAPGRRVKGPRGLIVSICRVRARQWTGLIQPPSQHEVENFFCLFRPVRESPGGDLGEHTLVLEPLDMIAVPLGEKPQLLRKSLQRNGVAAVCRAGKREQVDPVCFAPSLAQGDRGQYV